MCYWLQFVQILHFGKLFLLLAKVTASSLIDSFDVKHSENQVKRETEADTFTYFCEFIHSVNMKGKLFSL